MIEPSPLLRLGTSVKMRTQGHKVKFTNEFICVYV